MVTKHTFSSMAEFAAWAISELVSSGYFATATFANNTFTAYADAEGTHPVFQFEAGYNPNMKVYKSDATYMQQTGKSLASEGFPQAAWATPNGVMIDCTHRNLCAIITKNNLDETMCIIGGDSASSTDGMYTGNSSDSAVYPVVRGDDDSLTTKFSFNAQAANQTALVPFCSYAPFGKVSYSPNAFYMPYGQYYSSGFGKFVAGEKTYLTNGYWAILDA